MPPPSEERLRLLQEANRRGLLEGDTKAAYDEAVRRGLIQEATPFEAAVERSTAMPERRLPTELAPFDDVRVPARVNVNPPSDPSFARSFKLGFVEDPETQKRMMAESMFPGDPEAINRFGYVNGDLVFVNDAGDLERVTGGGVAGRAGAIGAYAPEAIGGAAMSASPFPVVTGAIGAMGGRAFKRIIGNLVFDEPQTALGNAADIATQGAFDVAGGAIGKGVATLAARNAVRGVSELDTGAALARRTAIQDATGIELDLAQVTNLPKLKALKIWARNFPGKASEIVQASDDAIAGQVDDAINRVLNTVSEPISVADDATRAGMRGINAAGAAIEAARIGVAKRAQPFYMRALQETTPVDPAPAIKILDDALATAKGRQAATLRRAKNLFSNAEGGIDTSIRGLHAAKLGLDEMMERVGSSALDRLSRRQLTQAQQALTEQLINASPAYAQGHSTFMKGMQDIVEPLRNSPVGVLANIGDQNAATAAAKLFNNGNITPQGMSQAKDAILALEEAQPEFAGTWNGLVRQWLESQFNAAAKELQTGQALNVAGKFRQRVFGTNRQKAALRNALGEDALSLFEVTMDALEMAARTPTASSATAFNQLISEEMRGSTGSITRAVAQPRQTLIDYIDEEYLQKQAVRIAEALTDPTKVAQLRALRELKPSTERSMIAAGIVGIGVPTSAAVQGASSQPADQLPPEYLRQQQRARQTSQ